MCIWFVIAYRSTSSYLLVISTVLESIDEVLENPKHRLVIGMMFQFCWCLARQYTHLILYLSTDWLQVMMALSCTTLTMMLLFKDHIWNSKFVQEAEEDKHSFEGFKNDIKNVNVSYIIFISMSYGLIWFTLGYQHYGIASSWDKLSEERKIFDVNILSALLNFVAKILAITTCLLVQCKKLPLCVLNICAALIYICLLSFSTMVLGDCETHELKNVYTVFLVLMSDFFEYATFGIMWAATPESFPKNFR